MDVCAEQQFDGPVFEAALRAYHEAGEAGCLEQDMTAIYLPGR